MEQKNWAVVRKHVGDGKLNSDAHFTAVMESYGILRLLIDFFEPSAKLLREERIEKGVRTVFDAPKTPCQRLLASEDVPSESKECLTELYLSLNPGALRTRLRGLERDLHDELMASFLDEAPN